MGFARGSVMKNLPAAAGGYEFNPWSEKIPQAVEQLSSGAVTVEPVL